jgi:2-polyprenyl-3-methyl-5-hydroxy-6-metoxy-1,4-benzoquinol methylase
MTSELVGHFLNRQERAQFITSNFSAYLTGRVLDVGCGDALLRQYVRCYRGVDLFGKPDVWTDLERGGLPFRSRAFQTAVCTDVLEHIDPLADLLAELFRVASEYVIVSLPNTYSLGYRLKFLQGKVIAKEYSLTPRNRHKWLPSYKETESFMRANLPNGWRIQAEYSYYPKAWWRKGPLHKMLVRAYPNLLATSYWGLFQYRS